MDGHGGQRIVQERTRPLPSGISTHGVWRFEGYTLDERTRQLTAPGGEPQRLNPSNFLVLQYLLLHVGQLCGQDELLSVGWTGRKVQTNSIAKSISQLRRLLDDPEGERIRLTHGYGYQLTMRASYEAGESLLERPLSGPNPGEPVPGRPEWQLGARIGAGACGEVYVATHAGGLPARAYKFAIGERGLRGLKRELLLQRHLQERHPSIDCLLPVLDAQLEWVPFFLATPWQPQGNLAEWARADGRLSALPRDARLAIALALCEAAAQLHAAALAHRDLKPENLYLLEAEGRYRVLLGDLGAGAGMLPPGVDSQGVPIGQQTLLGHGEDDSGSVLYLAPERLAGAAATIQSDLYALGLLVYQIVVGDLRRTLAPGWEAVLQDPLLAADIAEAANLSPAVRPASAGVLAERLRTLEARRGALREARQREAVERELAEERRRAGHRRRQLALLLGLVLMIATGLVVTLHLYRNAVAARAQAVEALQHAEREARTSRAVLDFMNQTLLDQADPWGSGTADPAVQSMLQRAAADIDQRFNGEPASAAAVHVAVADAWEGWGRYEAAMRHSRRALDLLATLDNPSASVRAGVLLKLCRQARMAQQLAAAESACEAGARIQQSALGSVRAELLVESAKLQFELGRCEQTLRLTDRLLARSDAGPSARWFRDALWFRGLCFGQWAQFDEARRQFERLLALPFDADKPGELLDRAWLEMDFAENLVMEGDFQTAQPWIESADAKFEARLGANHPDAVLAEYQLARIRFWSGDAAGAVSTYQGVLDNWNRTLGVDHLWTLYAHSEQLWARSTLTLSGAERQAGVVALQEARKRTLPKVVSRNTQLSGFAEFWAWTALALGELQMAEEELARARTAARELPSTHPRIASLYCIEADLAVRRGATMAARKALQTCLDGLSRLPPDHYRRRWAMAVQARMAG